MWMLCEINEWGGCKPGTLIIVLIGGDYLSMRVEESVFSNAM